MTLTQESQPLRQLLFDYLGDECDVIENWYQPFFNWRDAAKALGVETLAEIEKPYGVIKIGEEAEAGTTFGYTTPVEIWPYFTPGNFLEVDKAHVEIGEALANKTIKVNGRTIDVSYMGTASDYYDDELKAITRRMDFAVPSVVVPN